MKKLRLQNSELASCKLSNDEKKNVLGGFLNKRFCTTSQNCAIDEECSMGVCVQRPGIYPPPPLADK